MLKGHTGDIGASQADVVLPGAAFTEKQATYANIEGRAQQTLAAITPPAMARIDWKIVRAVSEISNHTLPYDTIITLRQRMAQISPNLVNYNRNIRNECILQSPIKTLLSKQSLTKTSKISPKLKELADYYQTDVISRASPTMAKCVISLKKDIERRSQRALMA
jgi:NADH dehydrogenase (ubiquinone) Fe-S protein 1